MNREKALKVAAFLAAAQQHMLRGAILDAQAERANERLVAMERLARQAMRNYLDQGSSTLACRHDIADAYYAESVKASREAGVVLDKYHALCDAARHERFLAGDKRNLAWRLENEWAFRPGSKHTKGARRRARHADRHDRCQETVALKMRLAAYLATDFGREPTMTLRSETAAELAAWAMYQVEQFVKAQPTETHHESDAPAWYEPDPEVLEEFEAAASLASSCHPDRAEYDEQEWQTSLLLGRATKDGGAKT